MGGGTTAKRLMRKNGFEGRAFKRPIRLWIEKTVKGAADFLVEISRWGLGGA
jgi:hypothetical protein